jgi:sulfite reductase alpha subunit-like flavoprotein
MNEEIEKLLNEICAGVEVPSDEEAEEAVEMQQG